LVANFQEGTMLNRLRKELEDSQKSLKNSESKLKQLSLDYLKR